MAQGLRGHELSQGEAFTLLEVTAAGVTTGTNGTQVGFEGEHRRFIFLLEFTAKATESNDTCDVYVDALVDDTWINCVHFTQALGNGTDAVKEYAVLDSTSPGTSIVVATSDAASAVVRPAVFGSAYRGRYVIVDPTGANAAFSFTVTGWAE